MNYLDKFFKEKDIEYQSWEIEDKNGDIHFIDNEVIIEFIKRDKPNHLRYADTLRRIDFVNGDVNNFFRYLAEKLINL